MEENDANRFVEDDIMNKKSTLGAYKNGMKEGYSQALEDIENLFLSTSEPWLPHVLENFINEKKASHNIDCTNSGESDKT